MRQSYFLVDLEYLVLIVQADNKFTFIREFLRSLRICTETFVGKVCFEKLSGKTVLIVNFLIGLLFRFTHLLLPPIPKGDWNSDQKLPPSSQSSPTTSSKMHFTFTNTSWLSCPHCSLLFLYWVFSLSLFCHFSVAQFRLVLFFRLPLSSTSHYRLSYFRTLKIWKLLLFLIYFFPITIQIMYFSAVFSCCQCFSSCFLRLLQKILDGVLSSRRLGSFILFSYCLNGVRFVPQPPLFPLATQEPFLGDH